MEHRKAPHRRQRHECPFERVGMHIGASMAASDPRSEEEKRSVATVSQREQAPINQGSDEVADGLSLHQHLVVNR
jgi:hypothetical protein